MKTEIRQVEIRLEEDNERRGVGLLRGTLLTYNEVASDRAEMFLPGALSWPENGVVINIQHDRQQPVTRVIPEVRDNQVVVDAVLPDTQRARDLKTLIVNGTLTGMSVEFRARIEDQVNGIRRISSADLVRAAVVDQASYAGSGVEARHRDGNQLLRLGGKRLWL